jgi:hypothetical protein
MIRLKTECLTVLIIIIVIVIIIINSICKALGFETTNKWYTYTPKLAYEEGEFTVL